MRCVRGDGLCCLTNERDFSVLSYPQCGDRQRSATMGSANSHQLTRKGKSMAIVNVGIDLAKNVFALHGVNEMGQVDLRRPSVPRAKLHELVAALPPCTIGMKRAPAHTTGLGYLPSTDTPSSSWHPSL